MLLSVQALKIPVNDHFNSYSREMFCSAHTEKCKASVWIFDILFPMSQA